MDQDDVLRLYVLDDGCVVATNGVNQSYYNFIPGESVEKCIDFAISRTSDLKREGREPITLNRLAYDERLGCIFPCSEEGSIPVGTPVETSYLDPTNTIMKGHISLDEAPKVAHVLETTRKKYLSARRFKRIATLRTLGKLFAHGE